MRRPTVWLGDQASLEQVLTSISMAETTPIKDLIALRGYPKLGGSAAKIMDLYEDDRISPADEDDYEEDGPDFMVDAITSQVGSVGLITVEGPLVSDESIFNFIFGETGYPTIARAAEYFADKGDVSDIVIAYSTSGGDSEGIDALGDVLKEIGTRKNLVSWTGSSALSAGYWLASVGSQIRTSKMATLGSVGVVTTVVTQQRRLEKEGLDVTVLRSGRYKALAHPAEALSEEAKAELQGRSDKLYGFFLDHVIENRPVTMATSDTWAEGRVHFADEALRLGLADGPYITLTDLIRELDQELTDDDEPAGDTEMPKQIFMRDEKARTRLAANVALDDLTHTNTAGPGAIPGEPPPDGDDISTEGDPGAAGLNAGATPDGDPAPAVGSASDNDPPVDLVAYMREELKTERAAVAKLQVDLAKAETSFEEAVQAVGDLRPIAEEFVQMCQVRLGYSPEGHEVLGLLNAKGIADKFTLLAAELDERFKVGRSSVPAEDNPQPKSSAESAAACGITPVR